MRVCVYTAITNAYESLNEQPVAHCSNIPFICFTEDVAATSATWQIRPLSPLLAGDDVRNHRRYKILPHRFLPEFDLSIYIDNAVLLKATPEEIFERYKPASGLAIPAHSFRATVLDEFLEVARDRLDDPARVTEQLANYRRFYADLLQSRPFWNGILVRDHESTAMRDAMRLWLTHIYRYSRRDQLSAPIAFATAGLRPDLMEIDNHDSWLHSWPHVATRRATGRLWTPETEAEELRARLLVVEQEAAAQEANRMKLEKQFSILLEEHRAVLEAVGWGGRAARRVFRTFNRLTRTER